MYINDFKCVATSIPATPYNNVASVCHQVIYMHKGKYNWEFLSNKASQQYQYLLWYELETRS